jgi:signal peptidase I
MSWSQPYLGQQVEAQKIANADFAALMATILARGKPFRFRAAGFSMSPIIRDGDVLTVVSPQDKTLQRGSVAAFLSPCSGKLAVHRVVAHRDGRYLLKGDNSRAPDGWVNAADVISVVVCVERDGNRVQFGGDWLGWLIAWLSKYNILYYGFRLRYALSSRLFRGRKDEQSQ